MIQGEKKKGEDAGVLSGRKSHYQRNKVREKKFAKMSDQ